MQLSQVSDQVLDNSDVSIRTKCPKIWFLSKNGQILDQKRVKQVRLAMVPRNSQLILFETYIQHQQFLITKK